MKRISRALVLFVAAIALLFAGAFILCDKAPCPWYTDRDAERSGQVQIARSLAPDYGISVSGLPASIDVFVGTWQPISQVPPTPEHFIRLSGAIPGTRASRREIAMEMCVLKYREHLSIKVESAIKGIYRFFESGKLIGVWLKDPEAMTEYLAVPQTVDSLCFGFRLTDALVDLFVRNAVVRYVSFPGSQYGSISMPGWDTIRERFWKSCPSVLLCTSPTYGGTSSFLESRDETLVVSEFHLRYVNTPLGCCVTAVIRDVYDVESLSSLREMTALKSL